MDVFFLTFCAGWVMLTFRVCFLLTALPLYDGGPFNLDSFTFVKPQFNLKFSFKYLSDNITDTLCYLYDTQRQKPLWKIKAASNALMVDYHPLLVDFQMTLHLTWNVFHIFEMSSYFNSTAEKMVLSVRVDGNEALYFEHDEQSFGNHANLIFGSHTHFAAITRNFVESSSDKMFL